MEQLPGSSPSASGFNVSELMHQLQVTNDELANLRVSFNAISGQIYISIFHSLV